MLAEAYAGRVSAFKPFFAEGRWSACTTSSAATTARPRSSRKPSSRTRSARSCAPGRTLAEAIAKALLTASLAASYAGAFSGLRRGLRRRARLPTSAASSGSIPTIPSPIDFHRQDSEACARCARLPSIVHPPLRARRSWRTWASRSSTSAPIARPDIDGEPRGDAARHGAETSDGVGKLPERSAKRGSRTVTSPSTGGEADNDGFNRLILAPAPTGARRRAARLCRLCAPTRFAVRAALPRRHAHPPMRNGTRPHRAVPVRFDPARKLTRRRAGGARVCAAFEGALANVPSLDEDRILRHMLNLIDRHAAHELLPDGGAGDLPEPLAFKIATQESNSPRAAALSRDLGLLRPASMACTCASADRARRTALVRPAAGLPHRGAGPRARRSGEERRHRSAGREGRLRAQAPAARRPARGGAAGGHRAYRLFISTLLDLTDNIEDDEIVPPPPVVRHDGDDPYLVVAADKGTATFSDIANEIAAEHDFWLGDAFASGGSAGYDHKKMGITARGAWECVKRHFREMGRDIQPAGPRGGRGRHVGRRVRQRHAALAHDPAGRRLRSPRHLHRSRSGPGGPSPSGAAVRPAALELAGLRQRPDLCRRRRVLAQRQSIPLTPEIKALLGIGDLGADADGADPRRPAVPDGSALVRRHRHLRQGEQRERRARSATAPTTPCASPPRSSARRSSARAPTSP